MSTRNDLPDLEQELRGATHAYADLFEPAPDSWAQLRARADHVTPRRSRKWAFGIGGLAIATTAAAVLAITLSTHEADEAIDVDLPTVTQPTTEPTPNLTAEWRQSRELGIARFFHTGEPGAADEWTVELSVDFWDTYSDIVARELGERIVLRLSPGEADLEHSGAMVDVCSSPPPGDDGRITCTGAFPASLMPDAPPFGPNWSATLATVDAGAYEQLAGTIVTEPIDADFSAVFNTTPDLTGTAYFRVQDDGETVTAWIDAWVGQGCWPPDAPPGGPDPCIERVTFQVGLPSTDEPNGSYHMVDICESELNGNESIICTGTFSGAADETWSAFDNESVAAVSAAPVEAFGQLDQVDIAERRDPTP